jgi:tellurite resistance protein TerC
MLLARRLIVIVAGFTVLIVGVAMIVLPGPAVVVIPLGLAILATEFIWARTLLTTIKERVIRMNKMKH